MIDEIKDADDDIGNHKLLFIGSYEEKFNFNTFKMSLDFLSAIYNGEIALKEAECFQKKLYNKINELEYNYKPKNEEKERNR